MFPSILIRFQFHTDICPILTIQKMAKRLRKINRDPYCSGIYILFSLGKISQWLMVLELQYSTEAFQTTWFFFIDRFFVRFCNHRDRKCRRVAI